ncbi:hypothetical protein GCM10027168_28540 [Streptomyces capparidis]
MAPSSEDRTEPDRSPADRPHHGREPHSRSRPAQERQPARPSPNTAFRALRGSLSPGEFASAVRRAAREIGEQVSCDARYIGRVESGEIQCPNYAYERVFRHMFPGATLRDLGFAPREVVRGRRASAELRAVADPAPGAPPGPGADPGQGTEPGTREETGPLRPWLLREADEEADDPGDLPGPRGADDLDEAADLLRAALLRPSAAGYAVGQVVRRIRLLDDGHGSDAFYGRALDSLHTARRLLDEYPRPRRGTDRLLADTGELALSVGWLAHDSLRPARARTHYAEALGIARAVGDRALEAHAFCVSAFLARDLGRPREALYTARAGRHAARHLASPRLLSLLALREAGGLAGLGDRPGCERAMAVAERLFAKGPRDADPEWMSFFGEAELAGLQAQCWSALGRFDRAVEGARRAVDLQDPHFTRNITLYTAELAHDLTGRGEVTEAAHHGHRVLELLERRVDSSRVRAMLATTVRALRAHHDDPEVAAFLEAYDAPPPARLPVPHPAGGPCTSWPTVHGVVP